MKPYTDTLSYKETTCLVTMVENNTNPMECGCGKGCKSRYPCLKIYVNYTRLNNNQVSTLLHENENFGEVGFLNVPYYSIVFIAVSSFQIKEAKLAPEL